MMDDVTHSDVPLAISAATLIELAYLVERGTFTQSTSKRFTADSGLEVVPIDNTVALQVGYSYQAQQFHKQRGNWTRGLVCQEDRSIYVTHYEVVEEVVNKFGWHLRS